MKKCLPVFLLLTVCLLNTGCNDTEELSKDTQIPDSQSEILSDLDDSLETSSYELTELKLEMMLEKGTHALELVLLEDSIYGIVQIIGESNTIYGEENPYYFVCFDKTGTYKNAVSLESPKIEKDLCCLKQFSIGQDGNIYALKTNYADTTSLEEEPLYDDRVRLVCWNTDGNIIYETKLAELDETRYANLYIQNVTVSKDGRITLCCQQLNAGYFMIQLNTDGSIQAILEDELNLYTGTHFWKNNDGSLSSVRYEEKDGKSTIYYYISYDVNTQTLQKEFFTPYQIYNIGNPIGGKDATHIFLCSDTTVHCCDVINKKLETLPKISTSAEPIYIQTHLIPLNENDFVCIYHTEDLDVRNRIGIFKKKISE